MTDRGGTGPAVVVGKAHDLALWVLPIVEKIPPGSWFAVGDGTAATALAWLPPANFELGCPSRGSLLPGSSAASRPALRTVTPHKSPSFGGRSWFPGASRFVSGPFAALLGLLVAGTVNGQSHLSGVAGATITVTVGARDGVMVGLTGKVWAPITAGGREQALPVAKFEVIAVLDRSCTARVKVGAGITLSVGMEARFDRPLARPPSTPPASPHSTPAPQLWAPDEDRSHDFYVHEGELELAAGDLDKAGAYFRKAIRDDRRDLVAQRGLMKVEAQQSLTKTVQFPPSSAEFRWIPPGSFNMGCTTRDEECGEDEEPSRAVTFGTGYWIAVTETTVGEYRAFALATSRVMPPSPPFSQNDSHPIVNVRWEDASAFCHWAGGRLSTEAEWEYAARGGQSVWRYPSGDSVTHDDANFNGTGGRDRWVNTAPVGSFPANGLGLSDMAGNVWEWCESPTMPTPDGDDLQNHLRPVRGGSWASARRALRVTFPGAFNGGVGTEYVGFRCALATN